MKPREAADIRVANLQAVWDALQSGGGMTRGELAAATGLSLMSISNLTEALIGSGLVRAEQAGRPAGGVGRRAEILRVEAEGTLWLVLDLTDLFFRWQLIRLDRTVLRAGESWRYDGGATFGSNLRAFLRGCREALGGEWKRIGGAAVVAPGPYDPASDTIANARVNALNELPLKAAVREELGGLPVFVDEDVKFAARAFGELVSKEESLYYLYAGEGVGGALIYRGGLFHSLNAVAGDPSLLQMLGRGPSCEGLTLRRFAEGLGIATAGESGDGLLRRLEEAARQDPARYGEALAAAADGAAVLLDTARAMLDPNAVVADCLWARPMQGLFAQMLRERLRPMLPLRQAPRVLEPVLPLHAPWYGAVKVLEKDRIRALRSV